jgi:thioredoxin 1
MKVLKFYADWCGPCKALSTTIEKYYKGDVPIENIDIDANNEMARQYNVRSVPLCVVVDENGNELRRKSGMMMIDDFENFLKG